MEYLKTDGALFAKKKKKKKKKIALIWARRAPNDPKLGDLFYF